MEKIFETAMREKYRYPYKGLITTEDLWDLNLVQLDSIYKALNDIIKIKTGDSLLDNQEDDDVKNQIEIVKYIFTVKQQEESARKVAAENREKRRHIMDILAEKEDESLRNLSKEDLEKMLDQLE